MDQMGETINYIFERIETVTHNMILLRLSAVFLIMGTVAGIGYADETYFFWYGSNPGSISWAPFDWEGQGRASGFADSVQLGEFYNHTPDAEDNDEL